MKPTVRLWLARHGDTSWNEAGRLSGWADPGLSPGGWAQARALGRTLDGRTIDSAWASDLRRAVETATIALEVAGSPVHLEVDHRLRELRFGSIEGSRWEELTPELRQGLMAFDGFRAPGGESVEDLRSRVWSLVDSLPAGDHLLVTHGGVIRLLKRNPSGDAFVAPGSLTELVLPART